MAVSLSQLLLTCSVALVAIAWCQRAIAAEQEGTPSCLMGKDVKVCTNSSLPVLLFVVGVEGSGHHLLESLIGGLSSYEMTGWSPEFHLYDPTGNNDWSKVYYTMVEEDLYRKRFQYLVNLLNGAKVKNKLGLAIPVNSYPMGMRPGMYATARPDLLDLKHFECQLYRIKFIVARRHPLQAVISSTTRFNSRFSKYGGLSRIPASKRVDLDEKTLAYSVRARIIEDNLIYIDQQLRRLDCDQVFFVDNDKFIDESTRQLGLEALATFLELNESDRKALLGRKLRAPKTKISIPPSCDQCIEKTLYDFFEERKGMWPLMNPH